MKKKKDNIKRLRHLYQKWVTEEENAIYYGCIGEAVCDIREIFELFAKEILCAKKRKKD